MTPNLPFRDTALLIRTDFDDDAAWQELRRTVVAPSVPDGFTALLDFIDDTRFAGMTADEAASTPPAGEEPGFVLLADAVTFAHPERPMLVVDRRDDPGRHFRVVPASAWSVENNLSLANMDFREFAMAVGDDGIFRGF